jgi:NADH-quinone oxidoreductase subunit K
MTVGLNAFILVAGLLFAVGLLGVTLRQNTLVIFMSLELMLNAVNLAFVAFSRYNGTMDGNLFVFFIITVAAAEVALGLAIIVALFRRRQSVMVDHLNALSRELYDRHSNSSRRTAHASGIRSAHCMLTSPSRSDRIVSIRRCRCWYLRAFVLGDSLS